MYVVERQNGQRWQHVCAYNAESKAVFSALANAERCKYRIKRKGKDVTDRYQQRSPPGLE